MPVTEKAMLAAAALTGRKMTATTAARNAMTGRMLIFVFNWILWLPREHGFRRKVTAIWRAPGPASKRARPEAGTFPGEQERRPTRLGRPFPRPLAGEAMSRNLGQAAIRLSPIAGRGRLSAMTGAGTLRGSLLRP